MNKLDGRLIVLESPQNNFETQFEKVQQAKPTNSISNITGGSLYAVLFNAREGPHSHDLRFVYHSLIDAGVSDENILILEGSGRRNRLVDMAATAKNLDSAVSSIRKKSNSKDRLLFYVTNHGFLRNRQCYIKTEDGFISEQDFEKMMQDLPVNFGVFYFSQCYSGGFAERMGYGNNIGMSNVTRKEESFGRWDKGVGACFTWFLFPEILIPRRTIETAFDEAVFENTSPERLFHKRGRKEGRVYPRGKRAIKTPQLRWQNANPSKLCLMPFYKRNSF